MTLAPGIHPQIDSAAYHSDALTDQPSLSASIAVELVTKSPAHARAAHPRLNPNYERPDEKKEWDIGTAAHALLLEGEDVAYVVEGYENWKTVAARDEAKSARELGKIPMLRHQYDAVAEMVDVARAKLAAAYPGVPLLSDGKPEQTLVWQEDGTAFRSRVDWLSDDYTTILDYKTARSANAHDFERQLYAHGYDVKAAFYRRAVLKAQGVKADFLWLVQEKVPPFEFSVVRPGEDVWALGEDKVDKAINLWRRCMETGLWPGYPTQIATAEMPPYEEIKWLERSAA